MNYIELINNFWITNIEHSFSGNESKLYFYLLHVSNSLGWKNPFKQSLRQLALGTGISINSVKVARNKLQQSGLISFKNGKQGKAIVENKSEYTLLRVSKIDTHADTQPDTHVDTHADTHVDSQPDTVNKLNKTKDNTPIVPKGDSDRIDYQKLIDLYHDRCPKLSKVQTLSESRKKAIRARVKEHGKDKIAKMLENAGASNFLSGNNDRSWVASFDWLFKPTNFVKVLDGNYNGTTKTKSTNSKGQTTTDAANAILARIEATQS